MRATRQIQTSFTAGEVDPRLYARIGVDKYYSAAALIRNQLVMPQGGVRRRPGMQHRASFAPEVQAIRCIPFAFNTEQTYCFAFTDGAFRVFLPNGALAATVTGCPWNAAQASQLNYAQSADTLLLFHGDLPPQRIRRGGSSSSWARDAAPLANIPTFDFGAGPEPVISSSRGWPECGTFHTGRLYLGGFRSRPATMMASVVGDFFNFDRGTALDDQAFMVTIDTDQVNAIWQMRSGRALQIFTSGAEHAITVSPPITPTNIAVQEQTRRGIKRYVPVVEVDGATLFLQRGGAGLRQFLFDDLQQQYRSELASLLAPHLIVDPVDMAARKGASQDDADHVLLVRSDGAVAVLTTLRTQEIAAFTRWETAGEILSVAALQSGEVFFAVRRAGTIRLEQWTEASRMDASVLYSPGGTFTAVPGLGHLEGQTIGMIADGSWQGTRTVSGGSVTLPRAATTAEIGLPYVLEGETLDLEPRDPAGALIGRKSRLISLTARVQNTGHFSLQGAPVVLRRVGTAPAAPLDTPPPSFTGDVVLRGLTGWRRGLSVTWSQPVPGPFQMLALHHQIALGEP
jgi:hypothetical protein